MPKPVLGEMRSGGYDFAGDGKVIGWWRNIWNGKKWVDFESHEGTKAWNKAIRELSKGRDHA